MQIDIDLKKYLNTKDYEKGIEEFIKNHKYINQKVPNLLDELKKPENQKLRKAILNL
jgi:hypothetical protein